MVTKIVGIPPANPFIVEQKRSLCRDALLGRSASWINKLEPSPCDLDGVAMGQIHAFAADGLAVDRGR